MFGVNLSYFLESKGVEYAPFDPNRFKNFYISHPSIAANMPKVVQIVGTNGKGSTGRFLAQMLKNSGLRVGHFTSPHILSFTERFWFDGQDADGDELEKAFLDMQGEFGDSLEELSYFEILTLLCYFYFRDKADYIVMEAGVGGEYDSTTLFKKELLLVTHIGLDHMEMLGESIEEITRTKLRASNCETIVGEQSSKECVQTIKNEFPATLFADDLLSESDKLAVLDYVKKHGLPSYLASNMRLAFAAAKRLGVSAFVLDSLTALPGRFQRVASNVIVDVGHNELAAKAVSKELKSLGKKVTLIFNCYKDKEPLKELLALKEQIERVEIISVNSSRIIEKEKLIKILDKIGVSYGDYEVVSPDREYLVFGSFSVVGEFLRRGLEKKV